MTGPKGNSEFCFPEILNVPRGEAERNIEGRGETKLIVSRGASHQVFCYTSRLKNRKNLRKNDLYEWQSSRAVLLKRHDNSLFLCS